MMFGIISSQIFLTTAPQISPERTQMGVILIPTLTLFQYQVEQFEVVF